MSAFYNMFDLSGQALVPYVIIGMEIELTVLTEWVSKRQLNDATKTRSNAGPVYQVRGLILAYIKFGVISFVHVVSVAYKT